MNEENIIFQYQVKKKTKFGTRYYYFYATTDIENYLNNKDIKYVRYAKDTVLNKQAKRIKELFKENKQLQNNWNELKKWLKEYNKHSPVVPIVNVQFKMQRMEQGKDE